MGPVFAGKSDLLLKSIALEIFTKSSALFWVGVTKWPLF